MKKIEVKGGVRVVVEGRREFKRVEIGVDFGGGLVRDRIWGGGLLCYLRGVSWEKYGDEEGVGEKRIDLYGGELERDVVGFGEREDVG